MNSNSVIDSDAPPKVKKAFEKFFKQLTPSHSLTSRQFSIFTLMREIIDPEINALVIAPTMSDLLPGIESFSVSGMWTESQPLEGIHEIQTWLDDLKRLVASENQLPFEYEIQIKSLTKLEQFARWDSFIRFKYVKQPLRELRDQLQNTMQLTRLNQADLVNKLEPYIFQIQSQIDGHQGKNNRKFNVTTICEYDRRIICAASWKNYLQQATRYLKSLEINYARIRQLIGTLETLCAFISYCNELKPKRIRTPKGRHNVQFSGIKSNRGNTISNYTGEPEFKYCSLCWKPTVFTINAIQTRSELKADQITYLPKIIGSRNYCETHDPSDSQSSYRKHLKRKDIFLNEVEAIYKGKNSNFRIPTRPVAFSSDDVRKLAYGLVHSRFKGNKEIVYLLIRQGIKQADIARRLGISRQAVSKLKASITKELEILHSTKWLTDAPERTPIFESLLGKRVIDFSLWAYSF